jgi:alpha-L-rhamnosidase
MGKSSCTVKASCSTFHEKLTGNGAFCWALPKSLAVKVTCSAVAPAVQDASSTHLATEAAEQETEDYLADFGKEFQGGLRLEVQDGKAGQTVAIKCGEALTGNTVTATWGWQFIWTLRDGPQVLEQHKYMECRFVKLQFSGVAPTNFTLSAWKTHYKWDEGDSMFTSSNSTLNAVFELARYTLEAASLDTFTDSNTRERDPYEADGIIAATSRLLIQRDVLWARHSSAYVFQFPTCPVEWMQITPFLAYLDYMWTGQPDLALAFSEQIYDRTMIRFVDLATGVINTSAIGGYQCHSGRPGMHIIDWMAGPQEADQTTMLGEYTESDHNSVDNMFAARGLEILATMLSAANAGETVHAGGGPSNSWARNATRIAATAAALKANIVKQMWNGTNFCNGICKQVNGSSLLMANMFALCFGMVEQKDVEAAWTIVADWGLENIGDYGAFWYQLALSGNNVYADPYETPAEDGGAAMLRALTKCDRDSWCSGLRDDNLTMTRESWHDGTYSHEWGSSPIIGVTWGVMGLQQTAPGFATFIVKPKLGNLAHAAITVPTLRGLIMINATTSPQHTLAVAIPCNSLATLCMPQTTTVNRKGSSYDVGHHLLLDGVRVKGVWAGAGHLCTSQSVGCGIGDRPRVLQHILPLKS